MYNFDFVLFNHLVVLEPLSSCFNSTSTRFDAADVRPQSYWPHGGVLRATFLRSDLLSEREDRAKTSFNFGFGFQAFRHTKVLEIVHFSITI